MIQKLALYVPGYGQIEAPANIPTGGLSGPGSNILQTVITILFVTAIVVALFMLIYSGIQWIMSRGDQEKLGAARLRIIFSIIGLVVIFLSFVVINVIGTVFGVKLLDFGDFGKNTGSDLGTYQNTDQNNNQGSDKDSGRKKDRKGKRNKGKNGDNNSGMLNAPYTLFTYQYNPK